MRGTLSQKIGTYSSGAKRIDSARRHFRRHAVDDQRLVAPALHGRDRRAVEHAGGLGGRPRCTSRGSPLASTVNATVTDAADLALTAHPPDTPARRSACVSGCSAVDRRICGQSTALRGAADCCAALAACSSFRLLLPRLVARCLRLALGLGGCGCLASSRLLLLGRRGFARAPARLRALARASSCRRAISARHFVQLSGRDSIGLLRAAHQRGRALEIAVRHRLGDLGSRQALLERRDARIVRERILELRERGGGFIVAGSAVERFLEAGREQEPMRVKPSCASPLPGSAAAAER